MHLIFDLKGSLYKREASKMEKSKKCPVYKDLDFFRIMPGGLHLDEDVFNEFLKTLKRDCLVSFFIALWNHEVEIFFLPSYLFLQLRKLSTSRGSPDFAEFLPSAAVLGITSYQFSFSDVVICSICLNYGLPIFKVH